MGNVRKKTNHVFSKCDVDPLLLTIIMVEACSNYSLGKVTQVSSLSSVIFLDYDK